PEPPPKPTPAPKPEPAPKPRPETPPLRQPRSAQPPEKRPNLARATREFAPARQDRTGEISYAPPSYQKALRRALARHKHYPWQARRRHQQGVVELYFVINRQGRVLEWQLRASSGFALLDQAVKKMIRNADLPPFPESMHISRMQVSIPVQFQLRRD
ncbi:MAG: energy transducer TonB, partial [Salinisphaera sp.]|nr:energy transducer TonB [Salinisphaera sp.]